MGLPDELGRTARFAITAWSRTLRLISLLAAATGLVALLIVVLRR